MTDPRPEPFTREDAANADARVVRQLLDSPGYRDFYEPFIIGVIQVWTRQLLDPSIKRHWDLPDDYLRGGIKVLEALLKLPHDVINAQVQKNRSDDHDETVAAHYERIAREGRGLPGVGPIDYDGLNPTDPI